MSCGMRCDASTGAGNHYGPWTGASITTHYAVDVNICPDTLPHEPKHSHMNKLHVAIAQYAAAIVTNPAQVHNEQHLPWLDPATGKFEPGTQQLAFVYGTAGSQGIAFIESQANVAVLTQFNGRNYTMPPYSVVFVDLKSGDVVYNTAQVAPAATHRETTVVTSDLDFEAFIDSALIGQEPGYPVTRSQSPVEQSTVTLGYGTRYLLYQTNITVTSTDAVTLWVGASKANVLDAFVDGQAVGSWYDNAHDGADGSTLAAIALGNLAVGNHTLSLLSHSLGFDNGMGSGTCCMRVCRALIYRVNTAGAVSRLARVGVNTSSPVMCVWVLPGSTRKMKGILGTVYLGSDDLTHAGWSMRPGLTGEALKVYTAAGGAKVTWNREFQSSRPLTWFKAPFNTPDTAPGEVVLLRASGIQRGDAYVNGNVLGMYWNLQGKETSAPTQELYHIPPDFLQPPGQENSLVFVDVAGATSLDEVAIVTSRLASGAPANPEAITYHC